MKELILLAFCLSLAACRKDEPDNPEPRPEDKPFTAVTVKVNGTSDGLSYREVNDRPEIEILFSVPVDESSIPSSLQLTDKNIGKIALSLDYKNADNTIVIRPLNSLKELSKYVLTVSTALKAQSGSSLLYPLTVNLATALDSTDKFPKIPDEELLTLTQRQTFRYFWELGHPVSGMARDRSVSGHTVTTGGTGFGIMAMIVASERQFISREKAVSNLLKITSFLENNCTTYHGAFPHWINGQTGETQPFSSKDNGADLVETALLFQGLLAARQYFSNHNADETALRDRITRLWEAVEWDWFCKDGRNVLYWHWSPDFGWEMNMEIKGWNECLIVYVLAASSPTHAVTKQTYDEGWTSSGGMKNGSKYYGVALPLGNPFGGPLFFAHYSFLGLNPNELNDRYADYWEQNTNHTLINYNYCVLNSAGNTGYSADCWGLTASDGNNGYSAHSPTNDKGVIAPTAALSSMPYTPGESMKALRFFYYKLGDKLWREYGFVDAFNLTEGWYDSQFLAIDQGPIIVMIENYRTGLLWNTFMSCPEIQTGLTKLGFSYRTGNR